MFQTARLTDLFLLGLTLLGHFTADSQSFVSNSHSDENFLFLFYFIFNLFYFYFGDVGKKKVAEYFFVSLSREKSKKKNLFAF